MEELLASIRKAIHDDIGEVPPSMSAQSAGSLHRAAARELPVRADDEAGSAATEIQQLREKISRSRAGQQPVRPASSLAAALQAEQEARRSWRKLEPAPRLGPATADAPASGRGDYAAHPAPPPLAESPRFAEALRREEPAFRHPEAVASWTEEPHGRRWAGEGPAALPPPRDPYRARPAPEPMLSGDSAEAVHSAFNRLAETVLARATGDRSIEDMTRELLRGMLKQWLDDNLPQLVERLVREEIERVARSGR
jgi:cell pole-organizing protein PopZ